MLREFNSTNDVEIGHHTQQINIYLKNNWKISQAKKIFKIISMEYDYLLYSLLQFT